MNNEHKEVIPFKKPISNLYQAILIVETLGGKVVPNSYFMKDHIRDGKIDDYHLTQWLSDVTLSQSVLEAYSKALNNFAQLLQQKMLELALKESE